MENGRWMDGWLGLNGILSMQIVAISCLQKGRGMQQGSGWYEREVMEERQEWEGKGSKKMGKEGRRRGRKGKKGNVCSSPTGFTVTMTTLGNPDAGINAH